jgi:hypothetical protein
LPGFFVSTATMADTRPSPLASHPTTPFETRSRSVRAMERAPHGMAVAEDTDSGNWNGLRLMK